MALVLLWPQWSHTFISTLNGLQTRTSLLNLWPVRAQFTLRFRRYFDQPPLSNLNLTPTDGSHHPPWTKYTFLPLPVLGQVISFPEPTKLVADALRSSPRDIGPCFNQIRLDPPVLPPLHFPSDSLFFIILSAFPLRPSPSPALQQHYLCFPLCASFDHRHRLPSPHIRFVQN